MKPTRFLVVAKVAAVAAVAALVAAACGGEAPTATPVATPTRPAPTATPAPQATATLAPRPTATSVPQPGATATAAPTATRPPATPAPRPTATAIPPTATPAGPQPKYGGTLKYREIREWTNWDTYHALGAFSVSFMMNLQSSLVAFDVANAAKINPDLAERWEVSGDGKTVTFFIRKGVTWSDGKALTAKDITWNLDRALNGTAPVVYNKTRFVNVASTGAPDDFTVKVNMKQPSASFLPNMAVPFMLMYAPHGIDPSTAPYKSSPTGTGPFRLKSYKQDVGYEFVKNPNYYKKDDAGRALPYLDGLNMFNIAAPAAALAAFRSKQIDCGCVYDTDYLTGNKDILEREFPGVKLSLANTDRFVFVFNQKAPWTDVRVRKAVNIGLDRTLLKELYRQGRGFYPPTIFLSPDLGGNWGLPTSEMLQTPGFKVKDGKKDPADTEAAKKLLADANVDPKNVNVLIQWSTFFQDIAEATQAALSGIGFKVQLITATGAQVTEALLKSQFDIAFMQGGSTFDDPSDLVPQFFLTNGPQNYGKWSRPEVDALYTRIENELDSAKRKQIAHELQRKLLDNADLLPLAYSPSVYGTHANVFGYRAGSFGTSFAFRLEKVWLG